MKKKTLVPLIVFLLGICLVGLIVYKTDSHETDQQHITAQLNATTYGERIKNEITNGIAVTDALKQILISENGKINQFDADPTPFDSLMDQPVEEKYLEVLKTSDVFNKAICTPDEGLLTWENLYEYPPFVAFFTQFVAAYQEIEDDFK